MQVAPVSLLAAAQRIFAAVAVMPSTALAAERPLSSGVPSTTVPPGSCQLADGFTFVTVPSSDGGLVAVAGWGVGSGGAGLTSALAVFGKTLDGPPVWSTNFTPATAF